MKKLEVILEERAELLIDLVRKSEGARIPSSPKEYFLKVVQADEGIDGLMKDVVSSPL